MSLESANNDGKPSNSDNLTGRRITDLEALENAAVKLQEASRRVLAEQDKSPAVDRRRMKEARAAEAAAWKEFRLALKASLASKNALALNQGRSIQ